MQRSKDQKKNDIGNIQPIEQPIDEKDKIDPVQSTDKAPTYDPVI